MQVTYDERKFTEMVLYLAERLRADGAGGATKLNTVLFFAEFSHVRRTGKAISGTSFEKLEHGPVPRRLQPVCESLVGAGSAEVVNDEVLGRPMSRLLPLRKADLTQFTSDELATIDAVLSDLDGMTETQLNDRLRSEAGWRLVEFNDTIPYEAALVGAPQVDTPTRRRLEHEAAVRLGLLPA